MMQRGSSRPAGRLLALVVAAGVLGSLPSSRVDAQEAARPAPTAPQPAPAGPPRPPQYVSPEVAADGRITFRIHAPNAQSVQVSAGDVRGLAPAAAQMTRGAEGI